MMLNLNGLILEDGVPQGSILGPLLFILHANNPTEAIHQNKVIQYGDDTTMSLVSNGLKEGLVDDLEGVARWVETNKLKLYGSVAFE